MIQASPLPIVLCCAEESEVALVAVVDALHREGHAPEVVPGVETDATLMTAATDRVRGPALFVLCQSEDLDRFQVRRLEGLFSARKGPAHRLVTIEVARRGTAAIVSEVRAAARDVGRGGERDEDDGSYMRDVVTPTSVAAVPGAMIPERSDRSAAPRGGRAGAAKAASPSGATSGPSSAMVQAPEGISDEALGLESRGGGSDTEVVDPAELHRTTRLPEPDVQLSTEPAARAALAAAGWTADEGEPSDGIPHAVAEDFPTLGESSPDVEVRGAPRQASWPESGPVEVERVARRRKADPRAESDDRPLPSASTPIDVGRPPPAPEEPEPAPRKGARLLLLLFAGAGMGAVITMAVLHATAPASPGPADVQERGVPVASETPQPEEREPDPTKVEPVPTKVEPAPVPVEPRPIEAVAAEDAGTGSGGADDSDGSTSPGGTAGADAAGDDGERADAGAVEAADADGGAAPPAEDGGGKLVPPPPTKSAGDGQLEAAIAEGRIRELGALLLVNTGPSTVTWDEAASRCSRRKVAGLGNWKLPTKGQLVELRRAKLLAPGSYWSRSTVGEDEAFVVDAGSGEASQWLKMEPNGRVVCVRQRPS
jgi:hypothetical protein